MKEERLHFLFSQFPDIQEEWIDSSSTIVWHHVYNLHLGIQTEG